MADTMTRALTAQDLADTFDAFNRHDIEGVMRHFADDAVFYTVGGEEAHGTRIEGREAIAAAFEGVWTAMPDAHWDHRGHFVARRPRGVGVDVLGHRREGLRTEAEGADLFTIRDGRLAVKQALRKQRPPFAA